MNRFFEITNWWVTPAAVASRRRSANHWPWATSSAPAAGPWISLTSRAAPIRSCRMEFTGRRPSACNHPWIPSGNAFWSDGIFVTVPGSAHVISRFSDPDREGARLLPGRTGRFSECLGQAISIFFDGNFKRVVCVKRQNIGVTATLKNGISATDKSVIPKIAIRHAGKNRTLSNTAGTVFYSLVAPASRAPDEFVATVTPGRSCPVAS